MGASKLRGAGGLGRECLIAFSLSGANCACVDLDLEACQTAIADTAAQVLQDTGSGSGKLGAYACDTTSEEQVEATVSRVVQDFGQIDVLITCAGICISREAEAVDLATWRKVIAVNLDGTYLFARSVGKHMLENKVQASYNASKSGVNALALSLATEWADRGIRVNSLSPGFMSTPLMTRQTGKKDNDEPLTDLQKEWIKQIPMGMVGQ
ncbi:unnamed protein product [Parascedosporium putredinis]|uniref:Uncharacterized protein n=1 Tax=Parascedosporium putredinis TaxID=1442378 RepID=A0A9P1GZ00_9PEZI|nr:unnamed protein product [Parascedosporium putredinis]CAI7992324.1 unnamed protein product [Parascedosporium putredinis]